MDGLFLKIDIAKAFDTISWTFIEHILQLLNFPNKFTSFLLFCLKNVTYTPILNGKKCPPFNPERGIKQGDPISPYIFILGMEYLSKLIKDQIQANNWKPFTFKNKNIAISHILFADDVLFFCKANSRNIEAISDVIKIFSTVSGMKINTAKSKVWFSKTVTNDTIYQFHKTFNVNRTQNFGLYLGFSLKAKL